MYQFAVNIAGHVIKLETLYEKSFKFFKDFITVANPEFSISAKQQDIERQLQEEYKESNNLQLDTSLESRALQQLLTERLIDEKVLLMHGSVVAKNNQAYLFSAPSGTGKTFHTFLWLVNCPDAIVVNGDKSFIKFSDDGTPPLACGSPWAGKENMYTNTMVPLKAIVLLERTEDNHIEQISFANAFPTLLQQTYRPEDPEKMRKTLQLLQRLDPAVSFWRFQCNNFKADSFPTAYRALTGREP